MEKTLISGAEKKGLEKGEAIGEQKKAYQIARQMEAKGHPSKVISELTALPEEEIRRL